MPFQKIRGADLKKYIPGIKGYILVVMGVVLFGCNAFTVLETYSEKQRADLLIECAGKIANACDASKGAAVDVSQIDACNKATADGKTLDQVIEAAVVDTPESIKAVFLTTLANKYCMGLQALNEFINSDQVLKYDTTPKIVNKFVMLLKGHATADARPKVFKAWMKYYKSLLATEDQKVDGYRIQFFGALVLIAGILAEDNQRGSGDELNLNDYLVYPGNCLTYLNLNDLTTITNNTINLNMCGKPTKPPALIDANLISGTDEVFLDAEYQENLNLKGAPSLQMINSLLVSLNSAVTSLSAIEGGNPKSWMTDISTAAATLTATRDTPDQGIDAATPGGSPVYRARLVNGFLKIVVKTN